MSFDNLRPCLSFREPGGAVRLRKFQDAAGLRRPFELEEIAPQLPWVAISFYGPDAQTLAARLTKNAEVEAAPLDRKAGFLFEFAPRAGEFVFSRIDEPLWHRPGAIVPFCPIWPAGMYQQDFDPAGAMPIERYASANDH
ncbi:MAG TPA: hypothetical protein VMD53_12440 [Rhizomicrobium sp.]|nr:hypothetical protein [Rhizomicrobium sp.]